MRQACIFAHRVLGYVNAPAIWQLVVAEAPDATVDIGLYQARRDLLCDALTAMGYDAPRPQGSFYVFPRTPIPDDMAFIGPACSRRASWPFPARDFGRGGYMRAVAHHAHERDRGFPAGLREGHREVPLNRGGGRSIRGEFTREERAVFRRLRTPGTNPALPGRPGL